MGGWEFRDYVGFLFGRVDIVDRVGWVCVKK